ncbi:uncharacterized protein LOC136074087 [Hydra vulgaris]|uniref:Uncharacterized protein LOC136074087 n=1 Tax=Hydra vulgaris TaxID=6087 RepID=A0ABM4B0Z9_HYDVU
MCSKFGEDTTTMEVVEGISLNGYEVIVTGGITGIGVETLRVFEKAVPIVFYVQEIWKNGHQVSKELVKSKGNDQIEVELLVLNSLESEDNFVQKLLAKNRMLNILINKAGVLACPISFTKNGFETQFGINYLGHYA